MVCLLKSRSLIKIGSESFINLNKYYRLSFSTYQLYQGINLSIHTFNHSRGTFRVPQHLIESIVSCHLLLVYQQWACKLWSCDTQKHVEQYSWRRSTWSANETETLGQKKFKRKIEIIKAKKRHCSSQFILQPFERSLESMSVICTWFFANDLNHITAKDALFSLRYDVW